MKNLIRPIASFLLAIFAFCTFGTAAFATPSVPTQQTSTVIEYAFSSSDISAIPISQHELSATEGEWGWAPVIRWTVRILIGWLADELGDDDEK
tara:strand:- start:2751 stop:3032 length:282 start_codon:yes stop_codon:yes gene_type:complete